MSKALSFDLRVRVLAVVAAARFGVSAASVSRRRQRSRSQGDPRSGALGGDRHSSHIEAHRQLILGLVGETSDAAIEELRRSLAGRGLGFGYGTVQRFLVRHGMARRRPAMPASRSVRMCWPGGRTGSTASPGSMGRSTAAPSRPSSRWSSSPNCAPEISSSWITSQATRGPPRHRGRRCRDPLSAAL